MAISLKCGGLCRSCCEGLALQSSMLPGQGREEEDERNRKDIRGNCEKWVGSSQVFCTYEWSEVSFVPQKAMLGIAGSAQETIHGRGLWYGEELGKTGLPAS